MNRQAASYVNQQALMGSTNKLRRLMDFYNPEMGDIEIPDDIRLRFVSPDDTTGSHLKVRIHPHADSEDTAR